VDEAVRWYMYEKQLYNLKRITRTETARILNTAIVESYKDNPFVVGFKWVGAESGSQNSGHLR